MVLRTLIMLLSFTGLAHAERLAPDPALVREAVVQVYGARTLGAKGLFGVHTWVAVKPTDAPEWTIYEVIGWRMYAGRSGLSISDSGAPDAEWYGAKPTLLEDIRGERAAAIIARLPGAAASYPSTTAYSAWPGPNSNTFVAHVARAAPAGARAPAETRRSCGHAILREP